MFFSRYSYLLSSLLILCFGLFLPLSNAFSHIHKHSIQLGKTIERIRLCGDEALVRIRKNDELSRLLTINLRNLNIVTDRIIDKHPFDCDETTGEYYFTSLTEDNNQSLGLFVYKKLGDPKLAWQYVVDKNYKPYTNIRISENVVLLEIRYGSNKTPSNLPNLILFNKKNGQKLWEYTYDTYRNESPELAVFNNMLYISSNTGIIQAYNLDKNTLAWEIKNRFEKRYKSPMFDKTTNTLITGLQIYTTYYDYAEVIGINPENGETKWTIPEYPTLYFPQNNDSEKLIYMQSGFPGHVLNVYHFENNEPEIQSQWKKGNSDFISPNNILAFNKHILVTFHSNKPDKYAYLFNDKGKKIDELLFEDITGLSLLHSNLSHYTVYATTNGEFGTLEF